MAACCIIKLLIDLRIMTADELKRWDSTMHIIDGLMRRCLQSEAWNVTFYERLSALESQKPGMESADIRKVLRERQRIHYQTLLQKIEKKDPGYAAELDTRNIEDVL